MSAFRALIIDVRSGCASRGPRHQAVDVQGASSNAPSVGWRPRVAGPPASRATPLGTRPDKTALQGGCWAAPKLAARPRTPPRSTLYLRWLLNAARFGAAERSRRVVESGGLPKTSRWCVWDMSAPDKCAALGIGGGGAAILVIPCESVFCVRPAGRYTAHHQK